MSIPLPPLPRPDAVTEIYTGHGYKDVWTAATVRARDQEIVREALEAAAKMIERWGDSHGEGVTVNASNMGRKLANNTRALEFHHE